jgi:hypothetical protein
MWAETVVVTDRNKIRRYGKQIAVRNGGVGAIVVVGLQIQ